MSNAIRQYLIDNKYNTASDETYSHIDEWLEWYEGEVPKFHNYKIYNGSVVTNCKRYRLSMAKKVCEDWANLLLNEKVSIKAGRNSKRLNEVLDNNNFHVRGNQLVELAFALGTGAIVEYKDENDNVIVDFIRADMIYPLEWDNGDVTECAFGTLKVIDGKEVIYLRICRKGDIDTGENSNEYYIENRYVLKETGKEINLPDNILPIVATHYDKPLFQIIMPNICNNIDLDSPLGISVFANSISQLQGCDLVYDSYMNEYVLGRKRILVPISQAKIQMEKDGVRNPVFDPNETVYYMMPGDRQSDSQPMPIDMSIRAQEHDLGIQRSLDLLSMKVGMGKGRYKFESGGVKTATEVISDDSDLYQNRQKNIIVIESALIAMAQAVLFLSGAAKNTTVTVDFDDSVIEDTNAIIDKNIKLVQAGLRSKVSAIMEINKCSEEEACKEIEKIAEDNQITGSDIDWTDEDEEQESQNENEDEEEEKRPIGFGNGDNK